MSRKRVVLLIGTSQPGGVDSVISTLMSTNGTSSFDKVRLVSHMTGTSSDRAKVALVALLSLFSSLVTHRIDLLHCHVSMAGSFWRKAAYLNLARLFSIPVVLHVHGSGFLTFWEGLRPTNRKFLTATFERATAVVVLSESWQEKISLIAPHAHIHVIPNCVFVPAPVPLEAMSRRSRMLLFMGLIGARKGVDDLLDAFSRVKTTFSDICMVIAGDGGLDAAKQRVSDLGLSDSVVFPGWINSETKARLLSSAYLYVLPSYNEGLPMSVLEAMSYGVPVVTTRVGGLPDLIDHQVDGLLINPGDVNDLVRSINFLLSHPEISAAMGANARQKVQSYYSHEVVLPMFEQLYEHCLGMLCKTPQNQSWVEPVEEEDAQARVSRTD